MTESCAWFACRNVAVEDVGICATDGGIENCLFVSHWDDGDKVDQIVYV